MQIEDKAITFRVPADLKERFEAAAKAERRSVTGALVVLMEQRVAELEADREAAALVRETA